jgi:hypothetical protein
MEKGQRVTCVIAGLFAGLLYGAAAGASDSLLLIYTPFFPLLWIGLSLGRNALLQTILTGALVAGLSVGLNGLMVFLTLFAIPVYLFIHLALRQILTLPQGMLQWWSVGDALSKVTLYAGMMTLLLTFSLYSTTEGAGFASLFPPAQPGEAEWMEQARSWLAQYAYFIIGATVWIQLTAFYGIAVLANFLLAGKAQNLRPSLAMTPFVAGLELLFLLLGAGVFSLFIEDATLAVASKAMFIALLYPYCLMGISRMHYYAQLWPHRRFWLGMVYVMMLFGFPFLILGFISFGLAAQARHLSNRFLSEPGQTS